MLSCLFIATLWSPAGIGQTLGSLVCLVSLCFRHFSMLCPVSVWYLIVSNPDLCILTYLNILTKFAFILLREKEVSCKNIPESVRE